jgi:hypothetical protein
MTLIETLEKLALITKKGLDPQIQIPYTENETLIIRRQLRLLGTTLPIFPRLIIM